MNTNIREFKTRDGHTIIAYAQFLHDQPTNYYWIEGIRPDGSTWTSHYFSKAELLEVWREMRDNAKLKDNLVE